MPLPQAVLARQQAAIFDRLGEDADWESVGVVRVMLREADESIRSDYSDLVGTGRTIKVRKSQVEAPAEGQTVQILDSIGDPVSGASFQVAGEPMLDRRDVWHCPVNPVGP